ncbi:MAG: hypothetical protein ACI8UD_000325 [Planctomycetota bacterium]|jgi:hypothetical protein
MKLGRAGQLDAACGLPTAANRASCSRREGLTSQSGGGARLGQRLDGNAVAVDLDGKPCKLQELLGRLTVISFDSTQSKTQREADECFATWQRDHAENGIVFVHLNSNANEIGSLSSGAE